MAEPVWRPRSFSRRRFLRLSAATATVAATAGYAQGMGVDRARASVVWVPPSSIDTTGASDVSSALNAWLSSITPQPGDVVRLSGTFVLSDSISFGSTQMGITGVTFDLHAATVTMPKVQSTQYGRPVLSCTNLHDCVVSGGTVVGANTTGADGVRAGLAGYHGVAVGGSSTNLVLTGQSIHNVWGDFVFVGGGNNQNLQLASLSCAFAGRHGVSVRHANGLTITGSTFANIRHLFFDHEPHSGDGLTGLDIGHCVGPAGGLGLFLQLLPLASTPCGDISVHDHILTRGHYHIVAGTGGVQRDGLSLEHLANQTSTLATSLPLIKIGTTSAGYDHVVISDVHDLVSNPTQAVECLNCPNPQVDLSGFQT